MSTDTSAAMEMFEGIRNAAEAEFDAADAECKAADAKRNAADAKRKAAQAAIASIASIATTAKPTIIKKVPAKPKPKPAPVSAPVLEILECSEELVEEEYVWITIKNVKIHLKIIYRNCAFTM